MNNSKVVLATLNVEDITQIIADTYECKDSRISELLTDFVHDVLNGVDRTIYYIDDGKFKYRSTTFYKNIAELIYAMKNNIGSTVYVIADSTFQYADEVIDLLNSPNVIVDKTDYGFEITNRVLEDERGPEPPTEPFSCLHIERWDDGKKVFEETSTDADKFEDVLMNYYKQFYPEAVKEAEKISEISNNIKSKLFNDNEDVLNTLNTLISNIFK